MAKHDLTLDIGTNYDGEGFKKLDSALKSASKETQKATSQLGKVVGTLSQIDGKAGQTFNKISGLASGFAQGGFIGLAIAGIGAAFSFVSDQLEKAKQRTRELAEEMRDKVLAALGDMEAKTRNIERNFEKMMTKTKNVFRNHEETQNLALTDETNNIRRRHIQERKGKDSIDVTLDKAQESYEINMAKESRNYNRAINQERELSASSSIQSKEIEDLKSVLMSLKFRDRKTYKEQIEEKFKDDPHKKREELKDYQESKTGRRRTADEATMKVRESISAQEKKIEEAEKRLEETNRQLEIARKASQSAELTYRTNVEALNEELENAKKNAETQRKAEAEKIKAEEERRKVEENRAKLEKERLAKEKANQAKQAQIATLQDEKKRTLEKQRDEMKRANDLVKIATEDLARATRESVDAEKRRAERRGETLREFTNKNREENKALKNEQQSREKNLSMALSQRDQLAKRVKTSDGRIRKSATQNDIQRLNELENYIDTQSFGGENLSQGQRKTLMSRKEELERKYGVSDDGNNLKSRSASESTRRQYEAIKRQLQDSPEEERRKAALQRKEDEEKNREQTQLDQLNELKTLNQHIEDLLKL